MGQREREREEERQKEHTEKDAYVRQVYLHKQTISNVVPYTTVNSFNYYIDSMSYRYLNQQT